MSVTCPNGHSSEATDFCDTCGAKIDAAAQAPAPEAPASPGPPESAEATEPAGQTCPNCQAVSAADSLFCEACGYDFTTGAMPRGATPAAPTGTDPGPSAPSAATAEPGELPTPHTPGIPPAVPMQWVAEIWIDPEWYAVQDADEPMPSPGLPTVVPLDIRSALIGRVSASKNILPDVDCTSDSGVSRRHAQLTTDGTRWFIEDLGSSNGTFIGSAGGSLPEDPIPVGQKRELEDDDRVYLGAWTRIVVREATDDEKAAASA